MTRRRHESGNPRPWVPLARSTWIPPTPERVKGFYEELIRMGATAEEAEEQAATLWERAPEMWKNDHVTCTVERYGDGDEVPGAVHSIHVRRNDRKAIRDWRVMQRIKNEIAGPEVEAVELYPAESRLVDTANSYWLWCVPPGRMLEVGFEKRAVDYDEDRAARMGARQRGET